MILRFQVEPADGLRRSRGAGRSVAIVDVNPAFLKKEIRDLIVKRLDGGDVRTLIPGNVEGEPDRLGVQIVAPGPTFEALVAAVCDDERHLILARTRRKQLVEMNGRPVESR